MDETTDPHMETDVSSTTEDVPEMQEVTGSNGNVVLIVEKIEEEHVESSPKTDEKPMQVSETGSPNKSDKLNLSPQKEASPLPTNTTNKSPLVKKIVLKRPTNPILNVDQLKAAKLNKNLDSAVPQSTILVHSEETVDSSSKIDDHKSPHKNTSDVTNKSPLKNVDVEITIRKFPSNVQADLQKSAEKSPSKEKSPTKIIAETTMNDSQKTYSANKEINALKTPVKSPPKEQVDTQKTPVRDQLDVQKPATKLPIKELSTEPSKTPKEVAEEDNKTTNGDHEESTNNQENKLEKETVIDKDPSNDSQIESLDSTEKDPNKSISRELKSLINSAKESKIISECTQLTSKTRKSRTALDSSNPLNTSVEADKIQGYRRVSTNSQKSNCSEKSEKVAVKRSMRSQNPEFVNKVKQFLSSVTKIQKDTDEEGTDEEVENVKKKEPPPNEIKTSTPKKKKLSEVDTTEKPNKLRTDPYCWRCHWAIEQPANEKVHLPMHCTVCPRGFHYKCFSGAERNKITNEKNWVCPECLSVLHAESSETRSPAMKKISLGMLCELLNFALQRMMDLNGVEPFMQPVDRTAFPDYDKYVVHPMDLSLMKQNIAAGLYGSTEAFLADAQWILHNSIIFNTMQSKLTGGARALVRSCRAEMGEIEACPECYKAAHARRPTWFTDVCTTPHVLLWAKLKGFPYWPAKGMSVNNAGLVDVRFFGAHDRAWVPAKDCFLYSEKDPNNFRTKRQDILDSMQEAEQHIRNISRKYGKFVYPPFKTQFDPSKLTEQIKLMIPSFEGEVRSAVKEKSQNSSPSMNSTKSRMNSSRSDSKSSKEGHDGDTSESEEMSTVATRKMADGAEIAREEDNSYVKDKTMDVDVSRTEIPVKQYEASRKRRHSQLEEAVITVIDNVIKEKKRKVAEKDKPSDKTESDPNSGKDVEIKLVESKKTEKPQERSENTPKVKEKTSTPVADQQKTPKVAPIKIITTPKGQRTAIRSSTPKIKLVAKKPSYDKKRPSSEKSINKDEKKHRNSRNRSLNGSNATPGTTPGKDKIDKKIDNSCNISTKDKAKEVSNNKNKVEGKSTTDKQGKQSLDNKIKNRIKFDDDTSLAVIARRSKDSDNEISCLPTISNVISLSTTAQNTRTTTSKPTTSNKSIEITIDSNSSIFAPTSTDNVNNMKDAVNKLQKLRSDTNQQSLVGKVGVRAFARMTSPPMNSVNNKDMQVEIKAEPIDLDDSDRQLEKMEVMNAFHLRPVNPPTSLREVRINKMVVGPLPNAKRSGNVVEVRPRAKKSFPTPSRPNEGRSELNGKNSMVYIPIQPPATPGPQRGPRPTIPASASAPIVTPIIRPPAPMVTTSANNISNITPSLVPISATTSPIVSAISPAQNGPTVGQATVHTVPLITSVNGQWTLALQPVMSVGGIDGDATPMVNGTDRLPNVSSITNMNIANVNNVSGLANVTSMAGITNMAGIANITSNVTGITGTVPIAASMVAPPPPNATSGTNRVNDTNSNPGEPPRLQQRPVLLNPLDPRTPVAILPAPPTAGPLTAKLNQNAVKLADFFRTLLEDSIEHLDAPEAQAAAFKLQLEQMRWRHQQEIDEINHNHELTIAEMRSSFEKERARIMSEVKRTAQTELEAAVNAAKSKQWCANCNGEAQFYCCWNTSYCDYPCQRAHWAQHFAVCTQKRIQDGNSSGDNENSSPPDRLQPQPENLPKNTPKLTAASTSVNRAPQQDSIIMSVMEDGRGNQTLKCVGTYKPPGNAAQAQVTPVLLNKQIMSNEDNSKKVVTSGGYLIVGGNVSNSASIVTQPRRGPNVQYITGQ